MSIKGHVFAQNDVFAQIIRGVFMLKQEPVNMNAKRSIYLIIESLIDIMDRKKFKEITVSEITRNAELVRNTFYAHFSTKEDVLEYYIFEIFSRKLQLYKNGKDSETMDIVYVYFKIWNENLNLLKLLNNNNLIGLLNGFENYIDILELEEYIYKNCNVSKKAKLYANTVYVDVLASIVKKWVKTGMTETPEELCEIFKELIS